MAKHSKKEIRDAIKFAEQHGWELKLSNGHPFGSLRCGKGCLFWVASTPRNPHAHAKDIHKTVQRCPHQNIGEFE